MAAISIVSYYTVLQLTNMAASDNNDVINNQNHVVEVLQGEHNKLERTGTWTQHFKNTINEKSM